MDACHANVSQETVLVWIMLLQLEKKKHFVLNHYLFNISSVSFNQASVKSKVFFHFGLVCHLVCFYSKLPVSTTSALAMTYTANIHHTVEPGHKTVIH